MDESICPGCAASLSSSQLLYEGYFNTTPECWSLFTEVQGKQYGNVLLGRYTLQSTVDAYAAQHAGASHPDKSVAIHLLGLYLVIVQDDDHIETVDAWAREVWAMWADHHQTIAELL